jgi:alcohol dehydrogenase class IV
MSVDGQMRDLSFSLNWPPAATFAVGAAETLGERAKGLGATRALLVTDQGLKEVGLADRMADAVQKSGVAVTVFAKVQPNPTMKEVTEGVSLLREGGYDFLIALGGGSSIDAAKVMSMQLLTGRTIEEIAASGVDDVTGEPVGFIAVPTTSGTGSEATTGALVKDATGRKYLVRSSRCRPVLSILDPQLTLSLPARMTAATGFDAFVHAVGSYTNAMVNPIADICAQEAIRLVSANLLRAVEHGDDLSARTAMMLGSHLAGIAIAMKGNDLTHGLSTAVESLVNCTHGESLSAIMPHVLRFNHGATDSRYATIARLMGSKINGLDDHDAAGAAIEDVIALRNALGTARKLGELGVRPQMIDRLTELAAKGRSTLINCRVPEPDQIRKLYEAAI